MRLGTKGQHFFVTDFETTGIDTAKDDPIEVGIIVCNTDFAVVATYQSIIRDGSDGRSLCDDLPAYRVHGITPDERSSKGRVAADVADDVRQLAKQFTVGGRKPVLVSDNIQFEWQFMQRLVHVTDHFHYCGWDTSLLLEASGVGDPYPVPHRALADAGLLHAAIVKALDRTRSLRA